MEINKKMTERGCDLGYLAAKTALNDGIPFAALGAFVKTLNKVWEDENVHDASDFTMGAILTFAHFIQNIEEVETANSDENDLSPAENDIDLDALLGKLVSSLKAALENEGE